MHLTKEPTVKKEKTGEEDAAPKLAKKPKPAAPTLSEPRTSTSGENKTLRTTTAQKRVELEKRQKERDAQNKLKTVRSSAVSVADSVEYRRLTQEELLAEAKKTEKINLASLDAYQKLELEKKKKVTTKVSIKGPIVRYHSVTMPLLKSEADEDDHVMGNLPAKQSRNFITFTDEATLHQVFPTVKPKAYNQPKKCVITGLPAKYFDPLTKCPYYNLIAFKALRELHATNKLKPMASS